MNVVYCVHRAAEWLDAADRLRAELGWEAVYWVTRPENHDAVGRRFPRAVRHRRFDAARGMPAPGMEEHGRRSLSLPQWTAALPYEAVAMDILNRIDLGRRFSYQERQRLYYQVLAYWLATLKACGAERVIFSAPPHSIGEYLLYAAARLERVPVRIFRLTGIHDLHFICECVEELPKRLVDAYRRILGSGDAALPDAIAAELAALRAARAAYKPGYVAISDEKEARYAKARETLRALLAQGKLNDVDLRIGEPPKIKVLGGLIGRNAVRVARREGDEAPLERAWKIPGRAIDGPPMTRWEHRTYRYWALIEKLKLEARYRELCRPLPPSAPYVYLAMHYQPERTTSPDGGRFSDQYAVAAVLAEALPGGWVLAVKEHPSQFKFVRNGEMARFAGYYDNLAALPNVFLVPSESPSLGLLDGARGVATVTGAVGWEALVRGKPVFCFGTAWYGACEGAFPVRGADEARAAFDRVRAGAAPDERAIRSYAAAVREVGRRVYHDTRREIRLEEPLVDALFGLLADFEP